MSRLKADAGSPPASTPEGSAWAPRWESEGAAWAARLAACCGRMAVTLGIREEAEVVTGELARLLEEPAALHASHPNWPSAMTVIGPPVEFSLRLDWALPAALRLIVDVTDHRAGLAANWHRYLSYARAVVGPEADGQSVWRLCQSHLSGIAPESRTRMLHGVGYGSGETRRATLYFRSWLEAAHPGAAVGTSAGVPAGGALRELLRVAGRQPATRVEMVGYDFSGGVVERAKLYCHMTFDAAASMLAATAPTDPHLGAARCLVDAFGEAAARRSRFSTDTHSLQLSLHGRETTRKLFLPCGSWGWATPEGFIGLIGHLEGRLGVDLGPLGALLDELIGHGIAVSPSYIAVTGGEGTPSVTFYFSPDVAPGPRAGSAGKGRAGQAWFPSANGGRVTGAGARPARLSDMVDGMITRGLDYVSGRQGADGLWRDYDVLAGTDTNGGLCVVEGPSTCFVSAYVGTCIAGLPSAGRAAGRAASALRARYRPGLGWGWNERAPADAETTALAICLLASVGLVPLDGHDEVLLRSQRPDGSFQGYPGQRIREERSGAADVTAAAVLALLHCGHAGADSTARAVGRLRLLQEEAGGWCSVWWASDLVATARAVEALRADAGARATDEVGATGASIRRAAEALLAWPVPADPFSLGHWLLGWQLAGGNAEWATIHRVVAALGRQQTGDGRWLGTPNRRIPRRIGSRPGSTWDAATVVIDGACLITTASVLQGLGALRAAIDDHDG